MPNASSERGGQSTHTVSRLGCSLGVWAFAGGAQLDAGALREAGGGGEPGWGRWGVIVGRYRHFFASPRLHCIIAYPALALGAIQHSTTLHRHFPLCSALLRSDPTQNSNSNSNSIRPTQAWSAADQSNRGRASQDFGLLLPCSLGSRSAGGAHASVGGARGVQEWVVSVVVLFRGRVVSVVVVRFRRRLVVFKARAVSTMILYGAGWGGEGRGNVALPVLLTDAVVGLPNLELPPNSVHQPASTNLQAQFIYTAARVVKSSQLVQPCSGRSLQGSIGSGRGSSNVTTIRSGRLVLGLDIGSVAENVACDVNGVGGMAEEALGERLAVVLVLDVRVLQLGVTEVKEVREPLEVVRSWSEVLFIGRETVFSTPRLTHGQDKLALRYSRASLLVLRAYLLGMLACWVSGAGMVPMLEMVLEECLDGGGPGGAGDGGTGSGASAG
ncbi:hypothetical protein CVT26_010601 [Gymnopilus dilepis]|uniref:Uncharacterized protein n=1 Tax=Gymnopilus dilepis TaxID=231916 RepID=A0A409VZH3_9AGAR|nr:hypothetical protein CVT26_010601 [Gymnopilus dilepis]